MTTVDKDGLLESAQDFTRRALDAYVDGDERVVLVYAAFAMEHLSKAYLCGLHPALLMELQRGSVDSLLHLVDLGDKARKAPFPRTISAKDALKRVEHVLPSLTVPKEQLHELIDVRDGVVHVGYLGSTSVREMLTAFLRYADALYDEIGVSERWGEKAELRDALVTQSLSEVEHRVRLKVFAAKRRYREMTADLDDRQRKSLHAERGYRPFTQREKEGFNHSIECPACKDDMADAAGEMEITPIVDFEKLDDLSPFSEVWGRALVHLDRFKCLVCGLQLDSSDEIQASGTAASREFWVLVHIDDLDKREEKRRQYGKLMPIGSRQPPGHQHPSGLFVVPLEEG